MRVVLSFFPAQMFSRRRPVSRWAFARFEAAVHQARLKCFIGCSALAIFRRFSLARVSITGLDHLFPAIKRVRILMRASVGGGVLRGVASEGASAFPGIVLRIESGAVAGGLSLLPWIIILIESGAACAAAAMIAGLSRTCYHIRNEADTANECEKCAKAG